jgi:tRNA A-37 threonylcarbamoyl transferase component Bud32
MGLPERIGRYPILEELGQGAMGTVYRGRDEMLDRDVALKVMSKGLADAHARERFLREAKAAARLQHPNIVVVYELGVHEGAPFMVLELLEGVDLQRAIDSGIRPDPRATLPVVLQLLAGLGHAHEHGIVHRDVKPSNVFLPFGRPAKIMDFGVARLAGAGTTTAGVVVGTPNYMSPEQASGGEIDGRSDLFSAGLILYELVTGEKAYQADTFVAILYKILHEAPDLSLIPLGSQWERLRAVLSRALARRAEDRYPDARAMSADLAQALSDLGGTLDWTVPADQALLVRSRPRTAPRVQAAGATAPSPSGSLRTGEPAPPPATPGARRPSVAAGLGGAALLAAGAVGAWLWLRPASPPGPPRATPSPTAAAGSATADASPLALPTPGPGVASPAPSPSTGPLVVVSPSAASATPGVTPTSTTSPATAAAPGLGVDARLQRAADLVARGRWTDALAEARAVLDGEPGNARATALAQQAEAEIVIEECLKNARDALKAGDRDRAMEELRRGSQVRQNDPRLIAMFKEVVGQ